VDDYSTVLALGRSSRRPYDVGLLTALSKWSMGGKGIRAGVATVVNVAQGAALHSFDWDDLVQDMLESSSSQRSFKKIIVGQQEYRTFLKRQTLHIQAAEQTSSYQWSESFCMFGWCPQAIYRTYLLDSKKNPLLVQGDKEMPIIPLQYVMPGPEDSTSSEGFVAPSSELHNFSAMYVGRANWNVWGYDVAHEKLEDVKPLPPLPEKLSVAKLASITSAAAGLFGSPSMLRQVVTSTLGDLAFQGLKATLPNGFQNLAICGEPLESGGVNLAFPGSRRCPFPARNFVDGGYADNMATAQTVAVMQRRFGVQRPLRLVIGDASSDWNGMSLLMAGNSWGPGEIFQHPTLNIKLVSPQVFAADLAELRGIMQNVGGPRTDTFYNLTWGSMSTTTVHNTAYGVAAGTPVELLVFSLWGKLSSFEVGLHEKFGEVAGKIAASEAGELLKTWMERTA
jgi:hypothetical protein